MENPKDGETVSSQIDQNLPRRGSLLRLAVKNAFRRVSINLVDADLTKVCPEESILSMAQSAQDDGFRDVTESDSFGFYQLKTNFEAIQTSIPAALLLLALKKIIDIMGNVGMDPMIVSCAFCRVFEEFVCLDAHSFDHSYTRRHYFMWLVEAGLIALEFFSSIWVPLVTSP